MNRIKTIWDRSFTDVKYRVLLHTCFWIFLLFFWTRESVVLSINTVQHYSVTLVGIAFALFLFYPLVYLIVPLFIKRKWFFGILSFLVYYIIAVLLRTYQIELIVSWYNLKQTWIVGRDFWERLYKTQLNPLLFLTTIFSSIPSLLEVIYLPLTIKFIRYAYRFNLNQVWLAKENAQLQLNTLKAQINPHFFFNTLNNLQSFIVQNERQQSIDLLNRLGDFMRSSLYDCNGESITMAQEITLLTNYIAIEQVRFETQASIEISLIDNDPDYAIPPFIFLPFIENVFKHGGTLPTPEIFIDIRLINDFDKVVLKTVNHYHDTDSDQKDGMGLQNVRQRLAHYFPGHHSLDIDKTENQYTLLLVINKS